MFAKFWRKNHKTFLNKKKTIIQHYRNSSENGRIITKIITGDFKIMYDDYLNDYFIDFKLRFFYRILLVHIKEYRFTIQPHYSEFQFPECHHSECNVHNVPISLGNVILGD